MAIQSVNLGAPPSGAGGDTFRTTGAKMNENFGNPAHAASRVVGLSDGNVMEVGAFGLGAKYSHLPALETHKALPNGFYDATKLEGFPHEYGEMLVMSQGGWVHRLFFPATIESIPYISTSINGRDWSNFGAFVVLNKNATIDGNGFIKAASPILKLFADKIDANDEAKQQEILFEKLSPGDYLIKGSSGFAQAGWYIETPKDANGNVLFSVIYGTLENGDISVKAYKKKFDLETTSIVADLAQPVDIPEGRWIDIRLQELPQPEFEPPASNTPADFQPTGMAKAVSEMMNGAEQ